MSEHGSKASTADTAHAGETRRDFIHIAAATVAAGGVLSVAWPFVQQLAPAADTRAASSAEVDVSKVPEGSEIRVLIGGLPFFIRHRTPAEIARAKADDTAQLRDPATDDSRLHAMQDGKLNPAILITSGTCTHLGCVPTFGGGEYHGWFCPCHGSVYDTSGRIIKGPAPKNLAVPEYTFVSDTVIKVG